MAEHTHTHGDPAVLYLDADTEITEAIEKLKKATEHEVRVVVPARSGLLQSAVNMKLLHKSAKEHKKALILVTKDKISKNLAGSAGIAVASGVKAMAHVPDVAKAEKLPEEIHLSAANSDEKAAEEPKPESGFRGQHIDLDEPESFSEAAAVAPAAAKAKAEAKKPSEPSGLPKDKKIPNFGKLNKRIWLAVAGVAVIILLVLAYIFIPTAKVTVLASAKKTNLNFNFILDSATTSSDISAQTLSAQKLELNKDASYEITATGKKDIGNKATGTISVKNCDDVSAHPLAAGSGVTGTGKSFVTAQAVTIPAGSAGGGVVNCSAPVDVQIAAADLGDSFNLGPTTFTLNGFSNLYKASGSTSGGSSKKVTVLSADDVAAAKKQAEDQTASGKDELGRKVPGDQQAFPETIQAELASFNTSVPVDNEADKVTVTAKVKYSEFMASKDDVNKLFDDQLKDEVKNMQVYQNGTDNATYAVVKQFNAQKVQLGAKAVAFYGNPIDKQAVAKKVAGISRKDVNDAVKTQGDQITGAQVETWPSLMPQLPLLAGRIKVEIKVSTE